MAIRNELKNMIIQFEKLINEVPDDKDNISEFLHFIRSFLRTKDLHHSLPSAEIMTILKKEKPIIFYYIKKQANTNSSLEILTELEINYEVAVQRLNKLKEQL